MFDKMQCFGVSVVLVGGRMCMGMRRLAVRRRPRWLCSTEMGLDRETIFALATGPVTRSGVAVMRISGPTSKTCAEALLSPGVGLPGPRTAAVRKLFAPHQRNRAEGRELLDNALVIWFPGPKSFTGEDVVELHLHGSRSVIAGISDALSQWARPAERGEFSRRAFANGRMDLTEIEGLADLLAAETPAQRRQALGQMGGGLSERYERWRGVAKRCLAYAEAVIDFGEDVEDSVLHSIRPQVELLKNEISSSIQDRGKGEIIREGLRIVILGPPNAGKSTMLNALAKRPAAIVSPIAGTTRDTIELRLELAGYNVVVTDTAGLRRDTHDIIEEEGMRRARDAASEAHIALFIRDCQALDAASDEIMVRELMESNPDIQVLHIINKVDSPDVEQMLSQPRDANVISCKTGRGLEHFMQKLECLVRDTLESSEESITITRTRHRFHLRECENALEQFLQNFGVAPLDMAAEDLRIATLELGKVTGVVHVEEMLDLIFSEFCIGK
mmetsp:Transcript_5144/g.10466  ORF Transcript_5144/g.10466 Transcript_5144/m.10466 type:complete len:502 (-) Transcript_5144:2410-3915(-)